MQEVKWVWQFFRAAPGIAGVPARIVRSCGPPKTASDVAAGLTSPCPQKWPHPVDSNREAC